MRADPSVKIIPILQDNYVFVILNANQTEAIIVDPGESDAVKKYIIENHLKVVGILLTHHHHDHIDGASELKTYFNTSIYAPVKNKEQIQFADHFVSESDEVDLSTFKIKVLELPGHTLGHIAYWFDEQHWLFSGDVLFGLGCGRLFEGTSEQMYASLQKIKKMPKETKVFCTHEYTEANLRFCKELKVRGAFENSNENDFEIYEKNLLKVRGQQQPSVPLWLDLEMKVNPFLTSKNIEQFTKIRQLRNHF